MSKSFRLEIVTPTKHFFDEEVEMVMVKTVSGYEGFMADHVYAIKLLVDGKLKIRMPGKNTYRYAEIKSGYIDVKGDVLIFTDRAAWTEI